MRLWAEGGRLLKTDGGWETRTAPPHTHTHKRLATRERTQPLPFLPPDIHCSQGSQTGPSATHLVALLTRVPLGSSLSSGTLSPQRTMQLELNLPALISQGRTRTRHPCLPAPPSLTAGPGGPGRPSDPGGPWGHKRAKLVTLAGGGGQSRWGRGWDTAEAGDVVGGPSKPPPLVCSGFPSVA